MTFLIFVKFSLLAVGLTLGFASFLIAIRKSVVPAGNIVMFGLCAAGFITLQWLI